ncbi:MAG: endolytic transglycosylase MltG, partial [Cyclobacteriaceae bacterium]
MGKRKILAVFLIVFSVMLSSFAFYGHQVIYTPNVLVDAQEDRILSIPKGMTFEELQNKLYDDRFVNELVSFSLVAKVLNYDDMVQPGHYTLTPNMTNVQLVKFLKIGNPPVRVPFNTARRLGDLINHFEKYLAVDSAEFMQYVARADVQAKYGFDEANMISMFLPDTYEFFYKSSPEVILDKMKAAYDKFWTEERLQKAENIGLTPQEVSVMASIVRGE